jgi:hypothetical protein
MTFERFSDYVKSIFALAFVTHLVISQGVIWLLLGRGDLIEHFFPIAGPLATLAGIYGWWIVRKTPPPVITRCPTCHQTVVERPEA